MCCMRCLSKAVRYLFVFVLAPRENQQVGDIASVAVKAKQLAESAN